MNAPRSLPRLVAQLALVIALLAGAGCQNIFTKRHRVLVDSISAVGAVKPSGQSYRLVAKKSVVNNIPVQISVIKACIDAALSGVGMFEAQPNMPPDMIIEVGFGQDSAPRVDPAARETYLQISGRTNASRSVDRPTGPEMWDVRVAVLGASGRLENTMPVLSSVAVTYIATDTHKEMHVDIPDNSPAVASVRESAIKVLDAKAGVAPAANAPTGNSAPANSPAAGAGSGPTVAKPATPASTAR